MFGHFNEDDMDTSWCSVFHPPDSKIMLAFWVLGLPFIAVCSVFIPDCRKPGIRRKLYIVTFIMAATGCALTCYLLFWVITVIGKYRLETVLCR